MATDGPGAARDAGPDLIAGLRGAQRSAYVALLSDAQYRRFFLATFTSSLGDWVGVLAILALTETVLGRASRAAAFALSGVMVARILPVLLFGPVAGVYADRWDRKRTLVMTDLGRGLLMAVVPFSQDFLQLFVASFVIEVLSMLFAPAKEATLPNIVPRERLVQANQMTLIVTYGTLPLGGVLFATFVGLRGLLPELQLVQDRPEAVAIWANALTFMASAALFWRMRFPPRNATTPGGGQLPGSRAWDELKEGLRFIADRRRVRALIVGVMAAALAAGALFALAKLFVSVVESGQSGFGVLVAVVGAGMLTGLLSAVPLERRFGNHRLFGPGIGVGGLFAMVVAFMPSVTLASVAAFFMGMGAGLAFVVGYTLLQESAQDEVRGRAFAAFNTGIRLALFVSLVVAPAVVGVVGLESVPGYQIGGVRITMALGGLVALIGAVWSARELVAAGAEEDGAPPEAAGGTGRSGWLVVLEGGEGAGKSTQLRLLRAAVERAGYDVVVTREPGGTGLGENIRGLLLDPTGQVDERAEALLYAAARAQHAEEVIRPALEKGAVVLCDRYIDSSVAYQGAGRGLGEEQVEQLSRWATADLLPDLVVLLDIDAREGLRRVGGTTDRLEAAGPRFHETVNEAFRRRARQHPERFLVLDGGRPAEELHAQIRTAVLDLLRRDEDSPEVVP